ncbi:hypothetical protein OG459_18295 [Streptomyces canus]
MPYPPDPADYASGLRDVREAAAEAGHAAEDITPVLFVSGTDRRRRREWASGAGRLRTHHVRDAVAGAGEDPGSRRRVRRPRA